MRGEALLDNALGEMWSFVAEAFCWFLNSGVELDDDIDTAVLLDYLNCAGEHASTVVRHLWGPLQSSDPEERAEAFARLCDRGVPDFMCVCSTDREHIAELAVEAIARGAAVYDACKRRNTDAAILDELDFVLAHLDTVVYLTDPLWLLPLDNAPELREHYEETLDACRRDVEESRELVRAKLQAACN